MDWRNQLNRLQNADPNSLGPKQQTRLNFLQRKEKLMANRPSPERAVNMAYDRMMGPKQPPMGWQGPVQNPQDAAYDVARDAGRQGDLAGAAQNAAQGANMPGQRMPGIGRASFDRTGGNQAMMPGYNPRYPQPNAAAMTFGPGYFQRGPR